MTSTVLLSFRKTGTDQYGVDIDHHQNRHHYHSNSANTKKQVVVSSSVPVGGPIKNCSVPKSTDLSRELLSSSLSTNYISSSSSSNSSAASITSDDEIITTAAAIGGRQSSASISDNEHSIKIFVNGDSASSSSLSSSVAPSPVASLHKFRYNHPVSRSLSAASHNDAFVIDEDDICNNNNGNENGDPKNEIDRQARPSTHALNEHHKLCNKHSNDSNSSITSKHSMRPASKTPTPDNCFISLYVNGKRCAIRISVDQLVYEPELTISSSASNDQRISININDIVSVWACYCGSGRNARNRKLEMCSCLMDRDSILTKPNSRQHPFVVKIFYAINTETTGLRLDMLTVSSSDGRVMIGTKSPKETNTDSSNDVLLDIVLKLKDIIQGFDRPKHLLFFVNPFSGSKRGVKIFDNKVKPLLELACVQYTLVVTERANHARDMILDESTDLSQFDGIVCIGGDGMFGEVLNGIVVRTQMENQINYDSIDTSLKKPTIKLGIIPAGSTDVFAIATSGFKDTTNSVMSILLGHKLSVDIGALHHRGEDKLLRYTASFLGYGFFGETASSSERNRWLGIRRYDWAGVKQFFRHRLYSGEIKLCIEPSDGSPKDPNSCGINCTTCQKAGMKSRETLNAEDSPACISIRGRFLAINAANVSCRCDKSKNGISPMCHVGNGCTDLILISKCSRLDYLRYLLRIGFSKKSPFDFNFVDTYRVREFEFNPIIEPHKRKGYTFEKSIDYDFFDAFAGDENGSSSDVTNSGLGSDSMRNISDQSGLTTTPTRSAKTSRRLKPRNGYALSSSVWNCDGEVINDASIHVKIHCQLVTLFANGCGINHLLNNNSNNNNN